LDPEEHWLLVNTHHAITDGWSVSLFLREVGEAYRALNAGQSPGWLPLPLQFLDYAAWQRSMDSSAGTSEDLDFWKRYLAGAPEVIDLPLEHPRPVSPSFRGGQVSTRLPHSMVSALESLSRRERVTPFMTLLALSQWLLTRYTGTRDILVGTPSAGRDQAEVEGLVGYFVNMLVLRTHVDDRESFRSQMRRTSESAVAAYAHQKYRFERLVKELCPQRSAAVNPLFQVAVLHERRQDSMLALSGLECCPLPSFTQTSKFDLSLIYRESAEGLQLVIEYSLDLFGPRTMERMLRQLETLLRSVLADPDQCLRSLTLTDPSEVRVWTEGFNATTREYPRDSTIHAVFEAEAARRPEAVALIAGERRMTYRELNERSEILASRLVEAGVEVGSKVTVCLERSPELIVALLGILKAGGAYVPLSPEYPQERLEWMLEDTQAPVLLTERSLVGRMPVTKARVLMKEEGWADRDLAGGDLGRHRKVEGVGATSLAYVMYTSGSTGRPKGVMIPHRGVVRLVKNTDYAEFGEGEVFLHFAPVSFDASTLEIWGPLLNGGQLVLMPAGAGTVEEIGEQIRTHGVTTLWLTSGLFNVMVDERVEDLRGLKQLLVGGDVLSVPHVKRAMEGLKGCRLINGYGPTENTTFTCCHRIESVDVAVTSIPIGRPIANTKVYIVDERMEPVPPGVWGELYACGDGLGLGYLNQDELTAEKFVKDPFGVDAGGRLYKTGDVCRWREDGVIEFQGRKDTQVKVRGYRIELGEIEASLGGLEGVKEGVVLALGEGSDQKRLVGFVVMREEAGSGASVETVKEGLRSRLPGYMVPELLVKVEALPLSPNGKVDRKELARMGRELKAETRAYEAPRTAMEATLAEVWREVLGIERVGRNDPFFEMGGHSLLALKLFARMDEVLGRKLPLATLFRAPTIAKMAAVIESEADSNKGWSSLVPVRPEGEWPPFFCVHGGGGEVLFAQDLLKYLDPRLPFYGLQARGLDDPEKRDETIEQMAEHYVEEILSVAGTGPIYLGGYCMGGMIAYEMARRLVRSGREIGLLLMIDSYNPDYMCAWADREDPKKLWVEKLMFQAGNLWRLPIRDSLAYFGNRSRAALARRSQWLASSVAKLFGNGKSEQDKSAFDPVRNEAESLLISRKFHPEPSKLDVLLFRPDSCFKGLEDPQMGWGGVVQGKLEVIPLPVNPGGMLVEPFVGILGKEMNQRFLALHGGTGVRGGTASALPRDGVVR
jgi:amino acid adenylation domain-containing protein